ncbi:MAG: cobalamin biosynthesis protein CobD [Deltaproteobacteria bacterium]|nr:cobalamin biosynthesis protein CobD [Deltaproteobacteria bacterium]
MADPALVLGVAFLLDTAIGDPAYRLHPVRLIGGLAALCERAFFRINMNGYFGGGVFFVLITSLVTASYVAVRFGLGLVHDWLPPAWDVFTLYSCFALRDQLDHARPVLKALKREDLIAARSAVQMIVGRDSSTLDAHGIARGAVESIAENFVDGFFAPVFWFTTSATLASLSGMDPLLSGVIAGIIYRTINTLDSMVGYRNDRYAQFGFISAKADDLVNYIPARLSIAGLFLSALFCRLAPISGLKAWLHDRRKHPSPNSGHSESFAAGALSLRLGGPTNYTFGVMDKPWLGSGTPDATGQHVRQCLKLVLCAGWICIVVNLASLLVVH